ncbi:MAG TPA: hypothetical protein VG733_01875 [Chthoniobacteraceae bacterium]|nr:hypothetical protein [Phycisphaerae bacterium]HWB58203.1 hypothetical protein [Chthoniobacteraceae bacterium]
MPTAAIKEILKEIDALDDADLRTLDRELARRLEKQWSAESTKARRIARKRKIDQQAIDAAIERRRYRR